MQALIKHSPIYIFLYIYVAATIWHLIRPDVLAWKSPCTSPQTILNFNFFSSIVSSRFLSTHGLLQLFVDAGLLYFLQKRLVVENQLSETRLVIVAAIGYVITTAVWTGLAAFNVLTIAKLNPKFGFTSLYSDCAQGLTPLLNVALPWFNDKVSYVTDSLVILIGPPRAKPIYKRVFQQVLRFCNAMIGNWLIALIVFLYHEQFWSSFFGYIIGFFIMRWAVPPTLAGTTPRVFLQNQAFHAIVFFALIITAKWTGHYNDIQHDVCFMDPASGLRADNLNIDIVIPAYSRPSTHLIETLGALTRRIPMGSPDQPFFKKVQIHVVNQHDQDFAVFKAAKDLFRLSLQGSLVYFHDKPRDLRQAGPNVTAKMAYTHVASSLWIALKRSNGTHIMLLEDDFELCPFGWKNILTLMCVSKRESTGKCGFHFADGLSGIMISRSTAARLLDWILSESEGSRPADEAIIDCLEGKNVSNCRECAVDRSVVIPNHLLFRHIVSHANDVEAAAPSAKSPRLDGQLECNAPHSAVSPDHNVHIIHL